MKLASFGQSKLLSDKEVDMWNCSDAVILPEKIKTPTKDKQLAAYCIANKQGQTAYVSCITTHTIDNETILAPQWVINKLNLNTDKVVLKTFKVEVATRLSIRFFSKEGYTNEEIHKALTRYTVVQSNSIITLIIRGKEIQAKIEMTEPNKEFVTLTNSNVYIEFLGNEDTFLPFYGKTANVLGGAKPEKTPKEMAREAALKRLAASNTIV